MDLRRTKTDFTEKWHLSLLQRTATWNQAACPSVSKNVLLAQPDTVLASSRSRPTKLRCIDLWSKRMKKEAVHVLWETRNQQVLRRFHVSKALSEIPELKNDNEYLRIQRFVQGRGRSQVKVAEPMDLGSTMQLCTQLQSDVRTFKHSLSPIRQIGRKLEPIDFVKTEVKRYLEDRKSPYLARKASGVSLAKRLDRLGVSFYKAQRKHKVDDL